MAETAAAAHSSNGIFSKRNIRPEQIFATLGNATRLRCLYLLSRYDEVCVCEIVEALNIGQPTASKALNTLKAVGLVKDERRGSWSYYRLSEDMPEWCLLVVHSTVDALNAVAPYKADALRYRPMEVRNRSGC